MTCAWKTYVVRRSGSEGWKGNYNKILESRQKIQETNIVFSNLIFFLIFFSLCFFCIPYFSLVFLIIIRTTKRQKKHTNKASNINKAIYYNYEIDCEKLPETMRKLCLSTKFPHQEVTWNYGIFRSDNGQIKIWSHIEFSEKIFNLESSGSHSFHLQHRK